MAKTWNDNYLIFSQYESYVLIMRSISRNVIYYTYFKQGSGKRMKSVNCTFSVCVYLFVKHD